MGDVTIRAAKAPATRSERGWGTERRWLVLAAIGLAYFLTGKLELRLAIVNRTVWAPAGIALFAFLVFGRKIWPAILVAAFAVSATTSGSILASFGIAVGNTLEGMVGSYLIIRFADGQDVFLKSRNVFRFALYAAIISTTASATIGTASLCFAGLARWHRFGSVWLVWWLGDAGGDLLVAPLLMLWSAGPRLPRMRKAVPVGLLTLAGVAALGVIAFCVFPGGAWDCAWALISIPILTWSASEFDPRETTAATFLFAAVAIWGVIHGHRPGMFPKFSLTEGLLLLQVYLCALAAMTLTLSVFATERRKNAEELERRVRERTAKLNRDITRLRRAEQKFRALLASAPDAMVVINRQGEIVFADTMMEKVFGYAPAELLGKPVEVLVPKRFRSRHISHRTDFCGEARVRRMGEGLELYGLRKDGSEFPVEISMSPMESEEGLLVVRTIRDVSGRKRAETELRSLARDLVKAQDIERRRLSRELHEGTAQNLVALKMNLVLARKGFGSLGSDAAHWLENAVSLAEQSINEIRTLAYLLYPPTHDQLGLRVALPSYADGFARRSGITTVTDMDKQLGRLPRDIEIALFHVVQESLTNLHRHSKSPTAAITLKTDRREATLEIRDEGLGITPEELARREPLGVGVRGMRQTIALLGGRLEVLPANPGTIVRVVVPISAGIHEASQRQNSAPKKLE
ncbi:MAG: MASE1 domain-containing protein [Terriglobia bacterium]